MKPLEIPGRFQLGIRKAERECFDCDAVRKELVAALDDLETIHRAVRDKNLSDLAARAAVSAILNASRRDHDPLSADRLNP